MVSVIVGANSKRLAACCVFQIWLRYRDWGECGIVSFSTYLVDMPADSRVALDPISITRHRSRNSTDCVAGKKMHPKLTAAFQEGVFPITTRITIGRFATPDRCAFLQEKGITHILNVSDAATLTTVASAGFQEVKDIPIDDFIRIPTRQALKAIQTLHAMLNMPGTQIYLHCLSGQMRSPTILWLYLIALGVGKQPAKQLIVNRCPDAQPGHNTLVDASLVEAVNAWGRKLGRIDRAALTQPAYE